MDIRQLRYFVSVVNAGSFTKAAEQLGITQPSLSQQIRALEKAVGNPLFERLGRSIRLTVHGQALLQPAMGILQRVEEANHTIARLNDGVRGQLRVGIIPTVMPYLIAPNIRGFLDRFSDVQLCLVEETTSHLIQQLQSGDLDLAICGLPVRNQDIVCSEFLREPLFLAVPEDHPFAKQEKVSAHDLRNERFLLLKEGHCLRDDVLLSCPQVKTKLRSSFESDQMASIFELVRGGFGVTVVPEMAARCSGCKLIPLEDSFRRVGYMRTRHHVVTKPMRMFMEWARSLAAGNRPGRVTGIAASAGLTDDAHPPVALT
jgi:LysR family transcriptional regulator, hydrogen peroxide-inducible genes activator